MNIGMVKCNVQPRDPTLGCLLVAVWDVYCTNSWPAMLWAL